MMPPGGDGGFRRPLLAVCRVRSLAFAGEWIDASGEGCDAVGARSPTFDASAQSLAVPAIDPDRYVMTRVVEAQRNDDASSWSPASLGDPLSIRRRRGCRADRITRHRTIASCWCMIAHSIFRQMHCILHRPLCTGSIAQDRGMLRAPRRSHGFVFGTRPSASLRPAEEQLLSCPPA